MGWQSSASNNRNRGIRYISLWGREQRTSSGGVGASGSTEEELARLQRQCLQEEKGEGEEEVLATLSGVVEPCTGKGVVELGLVQDVLIDGEAVDVVGAMAGFVDTTAVCMILL